MNATEDAPSDDIDVEDDAASAPSSRKRWIIQLFTLLVVLVVVVVAIQFADQGLLWIHNQGLPKSETVNSAIQDVSLSGRIDALESRLDTLDGRFSVIAARVEKIEKSISTPEPKDTVAGEGAPQIPSTTQEDITRLRNDMTSISGALSALQTQLQQSAQSAEHLRNVNQNQIALAVAFTQLRAVAASGEPFSRELENLKKAGAQNGVVMAAVAEMEPLASTGAPGLTDLRERFDDLSGEAKSALLRSTATTWTERLWAEICSLVSIRPIHATGGESDQFAVINTELDNHRLKEAIEQVQNLPEPVKNVLKDWIAKAQARQKLDDALNAVTAQIVDQATNADKATSIPVTISPSGDST